MSLFAARFDATRAAEYAEQSPITVTVHLITWVHSGSLLSELSALSPKSNIQSRCAPEEACVVIAARRPPVPAVRW